jgi:L-iditol 2-dehydrogenase
MARRAGRRRAGGGMQAVVKTQQGPGHVALREVPEPRAGAGQVKIAVGAAGICGTDLHIMNGEFPCWPPVTLGHEFAGTVAAVGEGVQGLAAGDPVVAQTPAVWCGRCRYCLAGHFLMCATKRSIGYGVDGAFASYILVPAATVHRLPPGIDLEAAALCEPAACAVRAVCERGQVAAGDRALVTGAGPMGLLVMQAARAQGARVCLTGTRADAQRLRAARDLGADLVVDVDGEDLAEALRGFAAADGVDWAFECSGAPPALGTCLQAVRRQGCLVQVGLFGRRFENDYEQIALKELTVLGSYGTVHSSWRRVIALIADGRIRTRPLITAVLPLAGWEEAFKRSEARDGVKFLLRPGE